MGNKSNFISWFKEIDKDDIKLAGDKAVALGEIASSGFPVPEGFVLTSHSFNLFIKENKLDLKIKHLIQTANFEDLKSIAQVSSHIKNYIMSATIPDEIIQEILFAYASLGEPLVAVRLSTALKDLSYMSFALQKEAFLNVKGDAVLVEKIKLLWASLFEPRSIFYREENKLDHTAINVSLIVQKMVESERSGTLFTIDPRTNNKSKIIIKAIYGLGELLLEGKTDPDLYEIDKNDFTILGKSIASQQKLLKKAGTSDKEFSIGKHDQNKQKISDEEIVSLAALGKKLENYFYFPQEINWAIENNKIYIIDSKQIDTFGNGNQTSNEAKNDDILIKAVAANPGIASGPVRVILEKKDLNKVGPGDILVCRETDPDYISAMEKSAAIVTDKGNKRSHAALSSKKLGIPAVINSQNATETLTEGSIVTVNGTAGEIYRGGFASYSSRNLQQDTIKTATKLYVSISGVKQLEAVSQKNAEGVFLDGGILFSSFGTHPKKILKEGKKKEMTDWLASEITKFCQAFDQRTVIYKLSSLTTDEYRKLAGGKEYEPLEKNPILGFRGALRHIQNPKVLEIELNAIKKAKDSIKLNNFCLLIPFVRSFNELTSIKKMINGIGLERSSNFKIWMEINTPENVILLDRYIKAGIDGISINTDYLTSLFIGEDVYNPEILNQYDYLDPAILWAFENAIKIANKAMISSSMHGELTANSSELIKNLVLWGITDVSVTPDLLDEIRKSVSQAEKEVIKKING